MARSSRLLDLPLPLVLFFLAAVAAVAACSSDASTKDPAPPANPCASAGISAASRFPPGSADGHPDPTGAKSAGQARAGRIKDAAIIRQPANARAKVRLGDFLLINEKVAVYIEAEGESDGYSPFGGGILGLEPVGEDGKPVGLSQYGESALALSRQTVAPESVTVMNDGSDGKAAVVRVSGFLKNIPFLDTFKGVFPREYDFPAAFDYVLEPGTEKVTVRLSLMNISDEVADFLRAQNIGYFQYSRSQLFTPSLGFAEPKGDSPWVAFDGGDYGFAWRMVGSPMAFGLEVSGFQYFQANGLTVDSCATRTVDYVEIIPGGPGIDGVRAAMRRAFGDATWHEVSGVVRERGGEPVAGAAVHVLDPNGQYLTRTTAGLDGRFKVHAPNAGAKLVAQKKGYALEDATTLALGASEATLELAPRGTIAVHAKDKGSDKAMPVRVQVIPKTPYPETPLAYGMLDEANGRLHQEFAVNGEATLAVKPGEHRVIVSRGYEWEILDQTVTVEAGKTLDLDATLERSVDSAGVMCADFHIHSHYSADSNDTVLSKVKSAIADGLEIPVSSEHEWIIDFQPVIKELGLTEWAFGFPSEEFTTFTWGHFGIIPIQPRPDAVNNGAIGWIGRKPPEVFTSIHDLPEKPLLIVNHPSGGGFGAYFSSVGFKRETASGDEGMWSDQFEALEVFNDSDFDSVRTKVVADWFAMLNAGKTRWGVGSSDSHHIRTSPVGYPRTCMRFDHDDPRKLSADIVRDVLARGAAVVSGGLFMTVEGPGGVGPGGTVPAGSALDFKVVVQAPSWLDADKLEVIVDGVTAQTLNLTPIVGGAAPGKRYEALIKVEGAQSRPRHWVVFHVKAPAGADLAPLSPGRKPFAVSNPIFF